MPSQQLRDSINLAFYNLSQLSEQLYDFWLTELYCLEGAPIWSAWNHYNLQLMEQDVQNLLSI